MRIIVDVEIVERGNGFASFGDKVWPKSLDPGRDDGRPDFRISGAAAVAVLPAIGPVTVSMLPNRFSRLSSESKLACVSAIAVRSAAVDLPKFISTAAAPSSNFLS